MSAAPGDFERDLYIELLPLVTAERLGSYLRASGGDVADAFALYEWNMRSRERHGTHIDGRSSGAQRARP